MVYRRSFQLLSLAAALAVGGPAGGCGPSVERYHPVAGDFTVVLIPDTQYYLGEYVDLFESQIQWIADHRADQNIVFAIHEGDMTNSNTPDEWKIVDRVMRILDDAGIPWSPMPGNHDGIKNGVIDSSLYNQYFGLSRFAGKPWVGEHYDDTFDSHTMFFDAGGMQFMVLSLAFGTPREQLDWADQVLSAHPDKRVIVATHAYLDDDGTYLERGETYAVEADRWTDGKVIWDDLISKHPNVFMTVCGHVPGQGRRVSTNDAGGTVLEILANYQGIQNGGDGYLRLLHFSPSRDSIYVEAYSPPHDKAWLDSQNTFRLAYPMPDPR